MKLAEDQLQAIKDIKTWWSSSKAYHILDGSAGVGKSFTVETVVKQLPRAIPILLAPTHKALRQLKEKTKGDYTFRTVASSLGIRPIDEGKDLKFEHTTIPTIWDNVNLAIIDECGLLDTYHIELFKTLNTKILYVGHKSQLPPVKRNRSMFDPCISPVFSQGYTESNLWIPKRNTGTLWEFNEQLEKKIYDSKLIIDTTHDISRSGFNTLLPTQIYNFISGDTKIALWTNAGVDRYNSKIRELIHPTFSKGTIPKYLPDDLVISTNSCTLIDGLEHLNDNSIIRSANSGEDIYTDTDGRVISCKVVTVNLCPALHVECYKIVMESSIEGEIVLYELVHHSDYKRIADYYEHKAWGFSSKEARSKAYRERSVLLKCFVVLKHFYASTTHRLQGSSVPNVLVIASDINRNSNIVERAKMFYVACSRCIDNLWIYKGI
jgi:hypothetical protein